MTEPHFRLLQVRVEGDAAVLTITEGQVEGDAVAQALQRELLTAAGATRNVIVDFQKVQYISSVAFGPLLHLRRQLQGTSGRLIVCGLNQMIGDIFYTTKMVDPSGKFMAPFELHADVPAALAALDSSAETGPASASSSGVTES